MSPRPDDCARPAEAEIGHADNRPVTQTLPPFCDPTPSEAEAEVDSWRVLRDRVFGDPIEHRGSGLAWSPSSRRQPLPHRPDRQPPWLSSQAR